MPFGLAIGTERAKTLEVLTFFQSELKHHNSLVSLQTAIQDELIKRGYSAEPGPFLAFESKETADRALQTLSWQNILLL